MFSSDDINRHNALYKILGCLFKHGINTDDKILLSSGRITSDIVLALRNIKIPFVVSKGAPTDLALYYGRKAGITIIGFSRGKRFNVYTWAGRIK